MPMRVTRPKRVMKRRQELPPPQAGPAKHRAHQVIVREQQSTQMTHVLRGFLLIRAAQEVQLRGVLKIDEVRDRELVSEAGREAFPAPGTQAPATPNPTSAQFT